MHEGEKWKWSCSVVSDSSRPHRLQPTRTLCPWDFPGNTEVGCHCLYQPRQHIKKQSHYFANKGPSSQGYGFSSCHVWMWKLDYKENWAPKNWCFWTVVLEKTLESPLDCKEIQSVHPKDQSWMFIGRTDVELKLQYFGHLMWRADSLEKTLVLGKTEGRRRRGWQRRRWLDGITNLMDMSLVMDREAGRATVHQVTKGRTGLSDWTELNWAAIWNIKLLGYFNSL